MVYLDDMKKPPPLICVVGQTATGKSSLGLDIAKEWNGEIICADSWTIRKGVNIGSAKPSIEDQKLVPHHLINLIEPDQDFNAALFKNLASKAIADITNRGKLPIMVGGTGLYIDSIIYDYSFSKGSDPKTRQKLNKLDLTQLLHKVNDSGLDISDIDVRNKRRLIRLIETNGTRPTKKGLRDNTLMLGVSLDKDELKQHVISRVDAMLAAGLESEVQELFQRYGWQAEALKGIGYAQWKEYFLGSENLDQVREKIIQATMNLAKRQTTWFQRNKSIHWLEAPVKRYKVVDYVTTFLGTNVH